MKFATGLVLAAIAVTAANAGNPAYLRSTVSDDASGSDDFDFSDSLDASESDNVQDDDDLMIDLTDLFGSDSDSTDGSHLKINIMSLIGSGSDQVDIQDIIDAFKEAEGSDASGSDDLSWLLEDDDSESGSEDPILVKGATKGKTPVVEDDSGSEDPILVKGATKGKTPVVEDDSGSEDPILVKGATKGKTAQYEDNSGSEDPILVKGATKGKTAQYEDPLLVKGGNKSPATKSSKSTKTGETTTSSIGTLYDDGSDGTIGDESEDPVLVKGATKGKTPLYEDDSDSASDEDDHLQQEQLESPATKTATKSSKTLW
ncbi:hypothetical protein JG688_00013983 [Phytophthora aleatoria]|uniref:RxLR effector protein n=1 Tax=Phytophthora aleatoria TaxID=2496075 RepID=A0A8J5II12_9STRA|nr:hypothetical protein JG688_00013983 [Phytophthora aleatoria]